MSNTPVSFGIIGGSGYALALLGWLEPLITEHRVRLHAAAVLPQEQGSEWVARARARGTLIFDNWEQMLEATRGQLDLCLIPTGIAQHRPMALRALELGHRVFLEKPIAGCYDDALAIVRCAQEHGDRLAIGFQDLYQPSTEHIHQLIWGGQLGQLRSVRVCGLWPRDAGYYNRNGWAGRVRTKDGWVLDSPLNNALAHYLNLALYWAGPETTETARFSEIEAELYRARAIENFDTASVRIRTLGGALVEFHASHSCAVNKGPVILIEGEAGRIDWGRGSYTLHLAGRQPETFALEQEAELRVNMFTELIRWINGEPGRRCTGLLGLGHSLCITLLHRGGRVATIDPQFIDTASVAGTPVIADIEPVFDRCLQQGGLPAEHGAGWSKGIVAMQTPPEMIQALDEIARSGLTSCR